MAMELIHSPVSFTIFLFTLIFSPSPTSQLQYFVNCGSRQNATVSDGRTFTGDVNSRSFRFSGRHSESVKNNNQSADTLYQTARIIRVRSSYYFKIPETGFYILRFHFYPFPETANSLFNVSASGHFLMVNFSSPENSLILKEFLLKIEQNPDFKIIFWPQTMAFINAIELISTSQNITEDSGSVVTPKGNSSRVQKSKILEKTYRVNVGASYKDPNIDYLWRKWVEDDPFLITKENAQNAPIHDLIERQPGLATKDDAPDIVYQTAKVLKDGKISNITWRFNLSKLRMKYFVRLHFCDIINGALNPYFFNVYFNTKFSEVIDPYTQGFFKWPFYKDYIFDSDDSIGYVDISIGPNDKSLYNKTSLFLNGLEIFEVKDMNTPDFNDDGGGGVHLGLKVGLLIGGGGILVILACVVVLCVHHKRKMKVEEGELFEWGMIPLNNVGESSHNNGSGNRSSSSRGSNLSNLHLSLKIPLVVIKRVTNNFDSSLIIGEGGFGKVYKGSLKNGVKVAVKRSNSDHGQGLSEFQTEITTLSKIRHIHLVSLIGYCYEDGEMILVYEFMEKGSLKDHLYGSPNPQIELSWNRRLEICIGAARGLDYLHTGLDNGIIHRDVKSTNILLDQNFVAKVADFGLSRSQHLEETHVSTVVKGTFGYLDPEYCTWLQLTEKSDVYSFGVLLLEVLCSRQVIDPSLPRNQINLVQWVKTCQNEGNIENIIDPIIAREITPNSLKKFVETAEKCLKDSATERPPMSDVLWDLEYALQLQKSATRETNLQEESITNTDASMSLPFPNFTRLPSQSFPDEGDDSIVLNTTNGGGFPRSSFERDGGR